MASANSPVMNESSTRLSQQQCFISLGIVISDLLAVVYCYFCKCLHGCPSIFVLISSAKRLKRCKIDGNTF